MKESLRLQSRGPVQDAALYVARAADSEVCAALRDGELCMVLGEKSSGKSSLRVRIGKILADEGMLGAHLPLGKLPSATPAAFCLGFMQGLGRALGLPPLNTFFQRHAEKYGETTPAERLEDFLREVVLGKRGERVVLFFDDLDNLDPACAEALLSALHGLYAPLAEGELPLLLGVCLTSATAPEELDLPLPERSRRVHLLPFTRDEVDAFFPAILPLFGERDAAERDPLIDLLLDAVYDYSGGQPYLVQTLCQQLVMRGGAVENAEQVEELVKERVEQLFPASEAGEDPMLQEIERRLVQNPRVAPLLALWRRVWRNEAIAVDPQDPNQRTLWLIGLSSCPYQVDMSEGGEAGPRVYPASPIIARVFDDEWARTQEARQLLRGAAAESESAKLRGALLKTAQTWALRHLEAVSPAELRALLLCLEAARQEAESRHQSSAAALQRENKERSELRSQWNREREELSAAAEKAQRRTQLIGATAVLLLLLSLFFGYVAFSRRNKSSPLCQMSPAPSVMNKSPAAK